MYQKVDTFSEGDLAYPLAPHTNFLQIGMTKLRPDYVIALVTDTQLDLTHFKLRDLKTEYYWIHSLSVYKTEPSFLHQQTQSAHNSS